MFSHILSIAVPVLIVICLLVKILKLENKIKLLKGQSFLIIASLTLLLQIVALFVADYKNIYLDGSILDSTFLSLQMVYTGFAVTLFLAALLNKSSEKTRNIVFAVLGGLLMVVFFPRNFVYDGVLNLKGGADTTTMWLRWLYQSLFLLLPMTVYFKNKHLYNISIFIGLPIAIITIFNVSRYFHYFTNYEEILASGQWYNWNSLITAQKLGKNIRLIQIMLEMTLVLIVPLYIIIVKKYRPQFIVNFVAMIKAKLKKEKIGRAIIKTTFRELGYMFLIGGSIILFMIPLNFFESMFVLNDRVTNALSISVAFIQFLCVAAIILLYIVLKRYSMQTRYMVLVIMSLALLLQFTAHYRAEMTYSNIPLQLCNLGTYVVFIAFITKWKPLIYFALIVNVTGAFIGLIAPEAGAALFSNAQMNFTYEHGLILVLPCLALALGIIKMPTKKEFKYAAIAYTCYFTFSLLLGVWLRNYKDNVNYFYLFNDVVGRVFPFTRILMVQKLSFNAFGLKFEFMPYYQITIYFGYLLFIYIFYSVFLFLEKFLRETKKALAHRAEKLRIDNNKVAIKRERKFDVAIVSFGALLISGYVFYTIYEIWKIAHLL